MAGNKDNFYSYVADRYNLDRESFSIMCPELLKVIIKRLISEKSLSIGNFGVFRIKWRKDKNIKTRGRIVFSPGFYKPVFKFSKKAKDYVNERIKLNV